MTGPFGTRRRRNQRGQAMLEFAILVPAFMIVLFGMLEFGFAFSHHLTLEYATREGARVGAALGNGVKNADGTWKVNCDQVSAENLDDLVIAAVQRVLTSPGSQVAPAQVKEIHIYKASSTGGESGQPVNIWVPDNSGSRTVDGTKLLFKRQGPTNWDACNRKKTLTTTDPDSIGVSLTYDYLPMTPLGTLLKINGSGTLRITDRTIMALNPSQG